MKHAINHFSPNFNSGLHLRVSLFPISGWKVFSLLWFLVKETTKQHDSSVPGTKARTRLIRPDATVGESWSIHLLTSIQLWALGQTDEPSPSLRLPPWHFINIIREWWRCLRARITLQEHFDEAFKEARLWKVNGGDSSRCRCCCRCCLASRRDLESHSGGLVL